MKKLLKIVVGVILALFVIGVIFGDSDTDTSSDKAYSSEEAKKPEKEHRIVYEDDNCSVEFLKVDKLEDINSLGVYLKMVNKTGKDLMFMLKNGSINNEMVTFTTGIPCTITSGKSATAAYIAATVSEDVPAPEEVEAIEFVLAGWDDDFDTIFETPTIIVEP